MNRIVGGDRSGQNLPLLPTFTLWLAISIVLVVTGWDNIVSRSGWDPDDQLRLVQLRDFLNGQSWFDTTQYRLNGDAGAPMHWSRLIELPLAFIILLLTPMLGQPAAEMVAGSAIPLLGLGLTAYMAGRIATHLSSREAGLISVLMVFISPALLMQFRPMRIDHHGWQIVMAVLALWTIFWPNKRLGGCILGLALAVWLHISLEGAPLTAAFFALLGWRWIFEKAQGQRLNWTIACFASATFALFFGTQSAGLGAAAYCDTISPPHIAAIAAAALVMMPAIVFCPKDWRLRLGAALLGGAAAAVTLFSFAPECAAGAFGNLDPLVRDFWYIHISEGLPVWHQKLPGAAALLAVPVCGLVALLYVMFSRPQHDDRAALRISAFFMLYGLMLSMLVFRTVSVATVYAIPVISVAIWSLFRRYRTSKSAPRRIGLVAWMLIMIAPSAVASQIFGTVAALIERGPQASPAAKARATAAADAAAASKRCQSASSVAALAQIPRARFLVPFDMGTALLLTTHHSALATSHHRNEQAMHDHISIFLSPPNKAAPMIAKYRIGYIALCPDEAELNNYAKANPDGLWSKLKMGAPPAWLKSMPPMGDGIQIWQVVQRPNAAGLVRL